MTKSKDSFDGKKITKNKLFFVSIRSRMAVMRNHKKAAKYPDNVTDQTIIQTMAGNS